MQALRAHTMERAVNPRISLAAGDLGAAQAIRARLRRDLGLDALDYGAESARASLALACQPLLYSYLGLEDACLSGVEKLAERADDDGLPLPGYVLKVVDEATYSPTTCAATRAPRSRAQSGYGGLMVVSPGECWPELTETHAVARLRAVLERHGGERSSEHHRVHAQGFLGGDDRLEGLRAALRTDPGNVRARCELATALDARGDSAGVAALGDVDPECLDRADFVWGDVAHYGPEQNRRTEGSEIRGRAERSACFAEPSRAIPTISAPGAIWPMCWPSPVLDEAAA